MNYACLVRKISILEDFEGTQRHSDRGGLLRSLFLSIMEGLEDYEVAFQICGAYRSYFNEVQHIYHGLHFGYIYRKEHVHVTGLANMLHEFRGEEATQRRILKERLDQITDCGGIDFLPNERRCRDWLAGSGVNIVERNEEEYQRLQTLVNSPYHYWFRSIGVVLRRLDRAMLKVEDFIRTEPLGRFYSAEETWDESGNRRYMPMWIPGWRARRVKFMLNKCVGRWMRYCHSAHVSDIVQYLRTRTTN